MRKRTVTSMKLALTKVTRGSQVRTTPTDSFLARDRRFQRAFSRQRIRTLSAERRQGGRFMLQTKLRPRLVSRA